MDPAENGERSGSEGEGHSDDGYYEVVELVFEPASSSDEDDEHGDHDHDYDEDEDEDPDYHDEPAEEDEDDFEDALDDMGEGEVDEELANAATADRVIEMLRNHRLPGTLTRGELVALAQHPNLAEVLFQDDDPLGDIMDNMTSRRRRRPRKDPNRFPKVPSEAGTRLMNGPDFGESDDYPSWPRSLRGRPKALNQRLLDRELGIGSSADRAKNRNLIQQSMIPSSRADKIMHFDEPVYSGQFSDDGNFFFAVCQDFKVRMYDTSNPYEWRHYKTVEYPMGQWTLTDASLDRSNRWLAYTSIRSTVAIAPTNPKDEGYPYFLNLDQDRGDRGGWAGHSFGIWSVRFSGDGRELVAGTNADSIVVYDIESRTVLHHVEGHDNDVNAVCFADENAPHVFYSGSDDATLKMWDRRSMGDRRPSGVFIGHTEGLTYIDSKGDGRYILSNGKDQSMKLWDARMALSSQQYHQVSLQRRPVRTNDWDYRAGTWDEEYYDWDPNDNSLVTYRGHRVLRTLIRCHFSPPNATNSHYLYTGSADGKVYVYNLDATIAKVIDVKKATKGTRRKDRRYRVYFYDEPGSWATTVRDASWHPNQPMIAASAWNSYNMARGTVTVHSCNSEDDDEGPPMGVSVNEKLQPQPDLFDQTGRLE